MEQAKKRDHKILITDIAIAKVPYVTIPGENEYVSQVIYHEHKKLLQIAQKDNYSNEVLAIIKNNGEAIIHVLGDENSVNPLSSPEARAIWIEAKYNELMYLHNHPSTNVFSLADIITFIRYAKIKIMSVVTNQGEVYILCKSGVYNYEAIAPIMDDIAEKYKANVLTAEDAVSAFLKRCIKGGIIYVKGK